MGKISHNKEQTAYTADYVVVGGGLAGCVTASKLSADMSHSVICVEAGNNNIYDTPITDSVYAGIEYSLAESYFPEYFWPQKPLPNGALSGFCPECDPQTTNCINQSCISKTPSDTTTGDYTTGKILGGGTSINGQQYVRGTNGLYDEWEKIGGPQWSSASATKVFKKIEKYNGLTSNSAVHGYHGPLDVRQTPLVPTSMANKFVQAITVGTGFAQIPSDDYNNPATPYGPFGRWQLTQQPDTQRESSATAFLGPKVMTKCGHGVNGRRLKVLFNAYANNIIWEKKRTCCCSRSRKCTCGKSVTPVGVRIVQNGISKEIFAVKKVIICLGIHSSEFLQRSGIGPKKLLDGLNIKVVIDNPNVGRGYVNQLFSMASFTANPADLAVPLTDPASLYTGGGFLPPLLLTDNPNKRGYQIIGASPVSGTFMIMIIPLQSYSKGTVRIQNADPFATSLADNNYLDPTTTDIQSFIVAFQTYIKQIAIALANIDPLYQLVSPTMSVIDDPVQLEQYIMTNFNHTHHWMSSNRMSKTEADGVVNGWGEVFGVDNLVVVDNSIAPALSDGNTSAPIYFLANVISDHIIKKQNKCHS